MWKLSRDKHLNNGGMKTGSQSHGSSSPPAERKGKLSALGKLFRPWKWKRKKKSEKLEKTAVDLERKISFRTSREELIRKGVLKEREEGDVPITLTGDQEMDEDMHPELEAVKEEKNEKEGETQTANGTGPYNHTNVQQPITEHQTNGPNSTTQDSSSSSQPHSQDSMVPSQEAETVCPSQVHPMIMPPRDAQMGTCSPMGGPNNMMAFKVLPTVPQDHHFRNRDFGHSQPETPPPTEEYDNVPIGGSLSKPMGIPLVGMNPQRQFTNNTNQKPVMVYPPPPTTPYSPSGHHTELPGHRNMNYHGAVPPSKIIDTRLIEEIPAREPNLNLKPKKSALKSGRLYQSQLHDSPSSPRSSGVGFQAPKVPPKPKPKPRIVKMPRIDSEKENYPQSPDYDNLPSDDSCSEDGEIHYRDDDEESSDLASKVSRKDSLAKFLSTRPNKRDLIERNILVEQNEKDRAVAREAVSIRLTRRLSLRPSADELAAKNILLLHNTEEHRLAKEEIRQTLTRKLSFRPSIDELKERKIIKFSDYVELTGAMDYDRRADKPWTRLTPKDKASIRKELNEFKSTEMSVHEGSRHLTRFHRP